MWRRWIAVLALATGVAALLCEHWQLSQTDILEMRALFGLVTAASITAVLLDKARSCSNTTSRELYLYTRLVSRWVYILMYVLAVVRVGLYLLEANQSSASHFSQHRILPPHTLDGFQVYILCCVVPLWIVRALVLAIPRDRPQRSIPSFRDAAPLLKESDPVARGHR
jgi:hypothetical protein